MKQHDDEAVHAVDVDGEDKTMSMVIFGVPKETAAEINEVIEAKMDELSDESGEGTWSNLKGALFTQYTDPKDQQYISFQLGRIFAHQYDRPDPAAMLAQMFGQMGGDENADGDEK